MFRQSLQLAIIIYVSYFFSSLAYASSPLDLNNNGIVDSEEVEVVLDTNASLPAGEYFFKNLVITNAATLKLERNIDSPDPFKGVKINAENITIDEGAALSASYELENGANYGYGTPGEAFYYAGASYGGVGRGNSPTSTYGSATKPTDLGSDGYFKGGGAIWLAVSDTLTNNGQILARGGQSASGGSIYVNTKNITGFGLFNANGGNRFSWAYNKSPGGGGRIAIYYETNTYTGIAEAKGGCGDGFCAGDGTVGYFDTLNNNFSTNASWQFLKGDSPFNFNKIVITDSATVGGDEGTEISASELLVTQGSSLLFSKDQVLLIPKIDIDTLSTLTFSGQENLTTDSLTVSGASTITVLPEHILHLKIPSILVTSDSAISAYGKGYDYGMGPGAPVNEFAGASYGGVGYTNSASSTYGSELEPVDFGSGGNGYKTRGGGAIRIESDSLVSDGLITAEGLNTSSGGSIYITTNTMSGNGEIRANGGGAYWSSRFYFMGGGGRIALYYQTSTFTGAINSLGGCASPDGSNRVCAGDGTVVNEQQVSGISNILFLPGIQASRLYKDGILGTEDQVWEPDGNQDVRQLAMTDSGESIENVYTRDIVEEAYGTVDVYNGFIDFMDSLVDAGTINDWTPFAYDWRYSVTDIAENGTLYEEGIHDAVSEIEALAEESLSGKVTLIAHSNGGLLAKAILNRLKQEGKTNLVDKVIFLAAPQLGTPEAIGTILHGYDQQQFGGLLIDDAQIRTVIKNMPGAYGLLPSQKYFEKSDSVPIIFNISTSTEAFRAAYGETVDDVSELMEFMVGEADGRGESTEIYEASHAQRTLLQESLSDHDTILDTWTAPEGIDVTEIVGVGLNTVHQFKYEEFLETKCTQLISGVITCTEDRFYKPKPQFSAYGDGTVMGYSAEGYGGEKKTWYVDLGEMDRLNDPEGVEHKNFGNSSYIQNLIQDELTHATSTIPFVSSELPSSSEISYTILSTHSPVTLEIIDSEGRRVGRGEKAPQTDIPGSTYTELAGSTYIIVPQGATYDVTIKGIGYGSMTFVTESLSGNIQTRMSLAEVATITPSTTIALSHEEGTFSNLMIDTDGDTVIDQELTLQGEVVVSKGTYLALRSAIKALPAKYRYKQYLLALTSLAEHFDKKSLAKKRFAKFESRILIRIEQILKYAVKKKQLTQGQITPILKIINTLK